MDSALSHLKRQGFAVPSADLIKTDAHIEGIRECGKVNTAVLDYIHECLVPGISTAAIDRLVHDKTIELGGYPAPLNYNGFPRSCCISINDVVCHGIPSEEALLHDGDIVNVDASTLYRGYYSDSSRMFCIGGVSEENRRLVHCAEECMEKGIQQVRPWGFLGDIGYAVSRHAEMNGYSVVRELGGHGIGLEFHEDPWVGFISEKGGGMVLVPGLVFTVEPMINLGRPQVTFDAEDGWTVRTEDGMPSAQWEKTVLVTESGHDILAR